MNRSAALVLVTLALSSGACAEAKPMPGDRPGGNGLRPPGDPNRAVRAELDAARRAGTLQAYDLFLARHPNHPLAEIARRERHAIAIRK